MIEKKWLLLKQEENVEQTSYLQSLEFIWSVEIHGGLGHIHDNKFRPKINECYEYEFHIL